MNGWIADWWVDGWMDRWLERGRIERGRSRLMDGLMDDGLVAGWMDRWMKRQMSNWWTDSVCSLNSVFLTTDVMSLTWSSSSHKEFFIYLSAQFMPCNVIYKTLSNMDSVYSVVNTYYSFCEAVSLTSSHSFSTVACACIASHTKTFFPRSSFLLMTALIHLWDFLKISFYFLFITILWSG